MGFSSSSSGNQGDDEGYPGLAEINIIPLVDIMLVLLIIFMVAAPLSITGMKINLPQSAAKGTSVDVKRIILTIDKSGNFFIGQQKIAPLSLKERLQAIFASQQEKVLYIRADRGVNYGKVIDAMSAAKLSGVNKMSMLTEPLKI